MFVLLKFIEMNKLLPLYFRGKFPSGPMTQVFVYLMHTNRQFQPLSFLLPLLPSSSFLPSLFSWEILLCIPWMFPFYLSKPVTLMSLKPQLWAPPLKGSASLFLSADLESEDVEVWRDGSLKSKYFSLFYFKNQEPKSQNSKITCPRSHSSFAGYWSYMQNIIICKIAGICN